MNFKFKKSGFTLVEVMLTITLIGTLATLTISTIGASIQQRARLAEFRSAYAKIDAALKSIQFDRGSIYACYSNILSENDKNDMGIIREGNLSDSSVTTECERFLHDFTRTMGATRSCETNPVTEGCIPTNYPVTASGCTYDFRRSKRAYVFDNSMILMTFYAPNSTYFPVRFALDINGRKGPNKWGQDIFPFSLTATETKQVNGKTYVKDVKFTSLQNTSDSDNNRCFNSTGGKSTREMLKESAGLR